VLVRKLRRYITATSGVRLITINIALRVLQVLNNMRAVIQDVVPPGNPSVVVLRTGEVIAQEYAPAPCLNYEVFLH